MLDLYHSELSVCSAKVRFALEEKQLVWQSRVLDMTAGEHQRHGYRKLNPNAVVPTLVHDGIPVIESTVINEYLDESFAGPALRPADALGRARMRLWTRQLDDGVHEQTSVLSFAVAFRHELLRRSPEELARHFAGVPDPARRERLKTAVELGVRAPHVLPALRRLDRLLGDMQTTLAERPWLAGADFSLADIGLAPYVARLAHLRLDFLWQQRPQVAGWFERLRQRPAYVAAHDRWFEGQPLLTLMGEAGTDAAPRLRALAETAQH